MVFIYEYVKDFLISVIYTIRPNLATGRQSFSFFGGSLCAADVNGDGLDDILISAPFYSDLDGTTPSADEGRVYVYINVAEQQQAGGGEIKYFSNEPTILSGSKTRDARFGTSMANAGDLNIDGFDDVAIGAPYEDDGRGVVYIYQGSTNGIVQQYSQRILGRSISDSVFTFGWYISKSVDIDGNSYPDIAVGNYLSDTAVVLRTRPIADIHGNITMIPPLIIREKNCPNSIPEAKEGCFVIRVCFSFTGRHLPEKLDVRYNLTLDAGKSVDRRRVRANTTTGLSSTASNTISVTGETGSCHTYNAFTLPEQRDRDIFPLVHVVADFVLAQPADPMSDIQPIMNITRNRRIEKDIAFKIECGEDGQCNADLRLLLSVKMSNPEDYVIINKTKTIYLEFELVNNGEDAFANVISVTWTGTLQYQTVNSDPLFPVLCTDVLDPDATYMYRCEVIRPVVRNDSVRFTISLDSHGISTTQPSVSVQAVAQTSSNETNVADDRVEASVDVRIVANIKITSAVQDDIRLLESQLETRHLTLLHRYVITNTGPSFLPRTSILVDVPTFTSSQELVTSTVVKIRHDDGREEFCSAVLSESEIGEDTSSTTVVTTTSTSRGGLPSIRPKRRKRSAQNLDTNGGNIGDITCDEYPCRQYRCEISKLNPGENIALNATMELPANNLPKGFDLLRYYTRLEVKQPKHPLFSAWQHPADRNVLTYIYIQRPGGSVNIWIIIGSVLGGLLLFLILLLVLWRLGFFKRTKKVELQKWKRESGYYQRSRSNTRGGTETSPTATTAPLSSMSETKPSLSDDNAK
ncbi:integrin alpha-4-like [Gigantopelta aegis]|uniref:integrin alpha-4-like n=1 Tax=Gigantopelta aegis TaxID=1735272 RepID=UPI001B88877D|nr:integrin alpha-4-like [Gigantopelta aegis]